MQDLLSIFTDNFGIQVSIIAVAVAVTDIVLYKLRDKAPSYLSGYLPLAVAMLITVIYGAITTGQVFTRNNFSAGIISYSLGLAFSVVIKKIFRGEKIDAAIVFLVSEITSAVCKDDVAAEIVGILLSIKDEEDVTDDIADVIKRHAKDDVTESEIIATVNLIMLSTEQLRTKK